VGTTYGTGFRRTAAADLIAFEQGHTDILSSQFLQMKRRRCADHTATDYNDVVVFIHADESLILISFLQTD
jgi:hypothetical protein